MDKMEELCIGVSNINENALLQKEGISNFSNLKADSKQKQTVNIKVNAQGYLQKSKTNCLETVNNKVTIIGDSVALGARKKLSEAIPNSQVDTKGNRSILDGYNLLMEIQNANQLGEYVVIALGTNGCDNADLYVEKIISDIDQGHRLIFVTPFDGHWNSSWRSYKTMQYLHEIRDKYPFVTIADWFEEISKQPQLLGADKTHIGGNEVAINLFTNKIIEGLKTASSKPAK